MVSFQTSNIVAAFAGGLIIGLATTLNLLLKGRITGMSGIFKGVITLDSDFKWKSSIISGLLLASGLAYHIFGFGEVTNGIYLFDNPIVFSSGLGIASLILAGLFVGIGTKMGNGCTSGHGVCGLPRLSPRSIAAVLTFMTTAVIMANAKHYLIGNKEKAFQPEFDPEIYVNIALGVSVVLIAINVWKNRLGRYGLLDIVVSVVVGFLFAVGLMVSGMSRRSKVLGFLTFNDAWDISLMFVLGGAVLFNFITFNYIINTKKETAFREPLKLPPKGEIDMKLLIGAGIFGLGWGLGGLCPGPAMLVTPVYFLIMIIFMISMAVGQYLSIWIEKRQEKKLSLHIAFNEDSESG